MDIFKREPVVIIAVVQAVLALFVVFHVDLSTDQKTAIVAVASGLMALLARSQVTPTAP